jgi:hypothetical protein
MPTTFDVPIPVSPTFIPTGNISVFASYKNTQNPSPGEFAVCCITDLYPDGGVVLVASTDVFKPSVFEDTTF